MTVRGMSLTIDELRNMLMQAASAPAAANDFFGRFSYVSELVNGNYSAAFDHGFALLRHCQEVAPEAYAKIHKGTPFYWLGTAAFLKHDYETAVFLYDAAVSEDLKIDADPVANSTPALRFIQIEGDQPEQAARLLVEATQRKLEIAIGKYNSLPGRAKAPLQLSEVRSCFLRRAVSNGGEHLRTLATAFISFLLEWDYMSALMTLRTSEGTTEPFFIHLFKGCLLFESLLKANPKNRPTIGQTLGPVLQHLSSDLGTPHDIKIGNTDFPTILASLPTAGDSVSIAIEYTGKIRNTVGHDLGWKASLDRASYDSLDAKVTSACLHAIACLYR
jgi:hypothetical protein